MATASPPDLDEDTCSVCLETFQDPVTLACQHTFCRQCLGKHIVAKGKHRQDKQIPCPCCNSPMQVPDPSTPVEEWVGQLNPGRDLQNVQTKPMTPDCYLCKSQGEVTPGFLWCDECELTLCERCSSMHKIPPSTHDHVLVKTDQKHRRRQTRRIPCKEHKEENIKLYCRDCDTGVCQTCVAVAHRQCKVIVTIESIIPSIRDNLIEHRRELTEKEEKEKSNETERNNIISGLESDKERLREEIQRTTQRVIEKIKLKEQQLIDDLTDVADGRIEEMKSRVKAGEIRQERYQQFGELIDETLNTESDLGVFNLFLTWKSGEGEQEPDVKDEGDQDETLRLVQSLETIDQVLDSVHLGQVLLCHGVEGGPAYTETDSRLDSDEEEPNLYDVTVLVVEDVVSQPSTRHIRTTVVTDLDNKCVKSFFTRGGQPAHSKFQLNESPHGIAKTKDNRVVVAVPHSRQIVTLEVTPDLVLHSKMSTRKKYWSLAVISPTTLAAGRDRDYVDILTMEGEVLRSVSTYNDVKLFEDPDFMCVDSEGNLLVSDCDTNTVTCLTLEGKVVWRYTVPRDGSSYTLTGITTTHQGDILVADWETKKIIQLTKSGEYVRDVVGEEHGLSCPWGICVDSNGSLVVSDDELIRQFIST